MEFEKIPLHDAVLESIDYQWQEKSCKVCGLLCSNESEAFELRFIGVSSLEVPQKEDWGPSSSINNLESNSSLYIINMQSGDQIVIKAEQHFYAKKHT